MATATSMRIYNLDESNKSASTQKVKKPKLTPEIDTAQYIAEMILELRNLAKAVELKTLEGLLEISYYEAFSCANHIEIPAGEEELLHQLGADARKAAAAAK
jgi:hypothetical protein